MTSHVPFSIPHLAHGSDRTSSVSSASSSSDRDSNETRVRSYEDDDEDASLQGYSDYPPKSRTKSKLQDIDSFDEDEAGADLLDEEERVGLMMKVSVT
jgi:hypothetical protein